MGQNTGDGEGESGLLRPSPSGSQRVRPSLGSTLCPLSPLLGSTAQALSSAGRTPPASRPLPKQDSLNERAEYGPWGPAIRPDAPPGPHSDAGRWARGQQGGGPRTPAPTREHAGQSHSSAVCGQGCKPAPGPPENTRASVCHHGPGRKPSPGQHGQSPPLCAKPPRPPCPRRHLRPHNALQGTHRCLYHPPSGAVPSAEGSGDGGSELGSERWGRSHWSSDGGTTGTGTRKRKATEDGWPGSPRG